MIQLTELQARKNINTVLLKMTKAKGDRKKALQSMISSDEDHLCNVFYGGERQITYHWEK